MNCYCINKRKIIHHEKYFHCSDCGNYADCKTYLIVGTIQTNKPVIDWQPMKILLNKIREQKLKRILK